MAVKIRLARNGAKKRPFYWVVITDSRSPRDGRFIEKVGTYNPLLEQDNPLRVVLQNERIIHWLSVGAEPTERVALFLQKAGLQAPKAEQPAEKPKAAKKKKAS